MDARIRVIGVGGGGGNALNNMISSGLEGVEFIVANTDAQALARNQAPSRIQIGESVTRGLGAGAKPEVGRRAAEESRDELRDIMQGSDMVFITAGMGGGTGTGAAPVIAQVAKELEILTVAVVTKPFSFEGKRRQKFAEAGLDELRKHVDTVITIPNQKLLGVVGKNTSILDAFRKADDVLHQAVRGITDLITIPGHINVDFADVRTVMDEMGQAMMGAAEASGDTRALDAATNAISSPLLDDVSIHGARGVLINITGGYDLSLQEIDEAATVVRDMAHEDANIVFGTVLDESMENIVRVTVVATGIGHAEQVAFPSAEASYGAALGGAAPSTVTPPSANTMATPPAAEPYTPPMQQQPQYQQPAPPQQQRPAAPTTPAPENGTATSNEPRTAQTEQQSSQQDDAPLNIRPFDRSRVKRRRVDLEDFSLDQANSEHSDFDTPTFLRRQMD
ncbi:MAG: cell division protein FtsZ [Magnetococcales bacterium]|nr:cell division protein FtsZ [Magnetococcales bacterium]